MSFIAVKKRNTRDSSERLRRNRSSASPSSGSTALTRTVEPSRRTTSTSSSARDRPGTVVSIGPTYSPERPVVRAEGPRNLGSAAWRGGRALHRGSGASVQPPGAHSILALQLVQRRLQVAERVRQ